jgi:glycosyltransferase involved in cell wall biosynthesis
VTGNIIYAEGLDSQINLSTVPFSGIDPKTNTGILLAFILRTIMASLKRIPADVSIIYSLTGLATEVIPGFIFKVRRPDLKWVVLVDNLVAPPGRRKGSFLARIFAYLGFCLSVALIKKADLIFTTNGIVKEGLIKQGIRPDKIKFTSTGIVIEDINSAPRQSGRGYDAVFVGRLHEPKGIFDLIQIWAAVCKESKDKRLALIGPGLPGVISALKEKISLAGLDGNIDLIGYVSDKDKFGIMKSSRVFVFPSHEEARPLVVMEAMACGLPVVLYDLPVFEELYPSGLVEKAAFCDFRAFAQKVLAILKDNRLSQEFSSCGREYARHFSWADIVNNEYSCLKESLLEQGEAK